MRYDLVFARGMSQIMLQRSAVVGVLFLSGVFYHSWLAGTGAVIGIASGTLAAMLLQYDKQQITDGLYGFNGALVGIAMFSLLLPGWQAIVLSILGAALSTYVMHFMLGRGWLPFTFPFVAVAWVLLWVSAQWFPSLFISSESLSASSLDLWTASATGFAQVMLQPNVITGCIFFLALLYHSRTVAVFSVVGTLLGVGIAYSAALPLESINIGLYSFNAVLCGIAFAQMRWSALWYAVIAIGLSVLIMHVFLITQLPALTFPFVLAGWVTVGVRKIVTHM